MKICRIGIIGTGKINSAVTDGLFRSGIEGLETVVSPRNRDRAERLASVHDGVRIAGDNQEVADSSDVIFAALLPETAEAVLQELEFRKEHTVLCLVPTLTLEKLKKILAPANKIFRAVPLLSVGHNLGPIIYYPQDDSVSGFLSKIGQPIASPDERQLHLLWSLTGLISSFYTLLASLSGSLIAQGADRELARRYTALLFKALFELPLISGEDPETLAEEAATPGGMNAMALRMVSESGAFEEFDKALGAVFERYPKI